MLLFKQVEKLQQYLQKKRKQGLKIGYAPTLGALQQGHSSLIEKAKAENYLSFC